jgi:Ca2+-binding EF-hand superfamily protein
MLVTRLTGIIAMGLLVGLAAGQAQEGFGRGPGRGRFPSAGFAILDTNGDGILDAEEIAAAAVRLAKLDKNSDGRITSDEARPPMPGGRGRGGPEGRERYEEGGGGNVAEDTVKSLMAFDANGDGKLSRDELPERFQGIFERADENKDGFLTPDEIRKVAAAQAAPSAGRSERGGPEGERRDGPGPGREMNFIRMDPVLVAVDTDGDGVLSAEEIRGAAQSVLKLDKDGDGKVTREEAMAAAGRGRG